MVVREEGRWADAMVVNALERVLKKSIATGVSTTNCFPRFLDERPFLDSPKNPQLHQPPPPVWGSRPLQAHPPALPAKIRSTSQLKPQASMDRVSQISTAPNGEEAQMLTAPSQRSSESTSSARLYH